MVSAFCAIRALGGRNHYRPLYSMRQPVLQDIMAGARTEKPLDRLSDGQGEAATPSPMYPRHI
jgi:hypothetical protein